MPDSIVELVEIYGTVMNKTDKSILISDGYVEVWLPRSLIDFEDVDIYNETIITMPEWLAIDKGLV